MYVYLKTEAPLPECSKICSHFVNRSCCLLHSPLSLSLFESCGTSSGICGTSSSRICGTSSSRICGTSSSRICGTSSSRICGTSSSRICGTSRSIDGHPKAGTIKFLIKTRLKSISSLALNLDGAGDASVTSLSRMVQRVLTMRLEYAEKCVR